MNRYILVDGEPQSAEDMDFLEWAKWFDESKDRIIEQTYVPMKDGQEIFISTVFLGFDHGFDWSEKPVLFETLVFNGPTDDQMRRYCTKQEAKIGHSEMVTEVMQAITTE